MAIDRDAHRVLVVFRSPPTLMALSSQDGRVVAKIETCGDADDVFVDAKRHRVYVSCGEGVVDVLEQRRGRLSAARARADGIGSAHLAVRSRARPAVCGGAGEVERAGGDLGVPSGPMKSVRSVAALIAAAVVVCWGGAAQAYRPFDGTDAAVAETGRWRSSSARSSTFATEPSARCSPPIQRINYGFTPGWEAALEGEVAHGLTARHPRDEPDRKRRPSQRRAARGQPAGEARAQHRNRIRHSVARDQ